MNIIASTKKSLIGIFIAIIVAAGGLIALGINLDNKQADKQQAEKAASQAAQDKAAVSAANKAKETISYDGVAGKNALEILKSKHAVSTKTFSFGELVQSIDGLRGDGPKYWTFYINGKMSDVGAGDYVTQPTDKITWKLEQQ